MNSTYVIIGIAITVVLGITIIPFMIEESDDSDHSIQIEYHDEFIIGTISSDASKMIKRFQPTADYIAEKLSTEDKKIKGKVVITKTIQDMEDLLKNDEIDLYYDSPFGVIYLAEETNGNVILNRWKENSESYNTLCFVKKESSINSMSDLPGKTMIFQGEESTTGFMLPVATLISKGYKIGYETNNDINFLFSGDDENTAHWIDEGKGDAGAVSNLDFEDFPKNLKSKLKIIGETKKIPRQLVMHGQNVDPKLVENIKNILLSMHESEEGIKILKEFKNTAKYTEFNDTEKYEEIVNMLKSLPPGIIG